jgi:hypothetical protein
MVTLIAPERTNKAEISIVVRIFTFSISEVQERCYLLLDFRIDR